MSEVQDTTIYLIRCALADLEGVKQAYEQGDCSNHDWKAHSQTISELEEYLDSIGELK
jgi:hypothetical protein